MLISKRLWKAFSMTLTMLLLVELIAAQIPGVSRESAKLTRLRPAEVHLANQTIMVKLDSVDPNAAGLTERLKKLITNRMIGVNKNLREVSQNPYFLVNCSITRYAYNERTEKKKLLMVKEQGTFKIITANLEASYNVVRTSGNFTLFGGNIPVSYKKEFQQTVDTAPVKAEVENALIRGIVDGILAKLTNTEEIIEARLMGKGGLGRFSRLAQARQWAEYIQSIQALPEQKPDKEGKSSFEGDRYYNLSIAHEARFYETMWKDYKRAEQYFDLADSALRKARQYDPRESEYIKAQARLGQGKQYFDTIRERFPKDFDNEKADTGAGERGTSGATDRGTTTKVVEPSTPGSMTNRDVIEMVQSGVSERLIIEQINEAKVKQFDVSTRGIIQLTRAGVSEKIIDVIKSVMRRQSPARQRK